ncbi:hypothetical protein SAMN05443247_01747 [Bradyrhizobium erythrophlei]|nr:hypothetical protein SAMN05443247_01747 [Bradyrhizobium erythrophlei]
MVGRRSPRGFKGVGSVGPLLAVLMSVQQGRASVPLMYSRHPPVHFSFSSVNAGFGLNLPLRLKLTQSFKPQPFQAPRLRSVLAGPTPPPI